MAKNDAKVRIILTALRADRMVCAFCGDAVHIGGDALDPKRAEVCHLRASARGGSDHWTNTVVGCRACNDATGDDDAPAPVWNPPTEPTVTYAEAAAWRAGRRAAYDAAVDAARARWVR